MKHGTTYHLSLNISGALAQSNKSLDGLLGDEEGRVFTGAEVKDFLRKVRHESGYTRYSGCDNMKADGGCGGHAITPPADVDAS